MTERLAVSTLEAHRDPRWPADDPASRERLVLDPLPLVHRLCRRFRNSGGMLEDLVQAGCIGLLSAIKKCATWRGAGAELTAFLP